MKRVRKGIDIEKDRKKKQKKIFIEHELMIYPHLFCVNEVGLISW